MRTMRPLFVTGFLMGFAAFAQAAPDSSASIGAGATARSPVVTSSAPASPGTPHWSAAIGRALVSNEDGRPAKGTAAQSAHWSATIGTGRAS